MAYIKDPATGKYIKTDSAPAISSAPSKPATPITSPVAPSTSMPAVKYVKDASGKYTTVPSDSSTPLMGKPNVTTVDGLRQYAAQNGVDVSDAQPKESFLQGLLHVLNTGAYAVGGLISGKGVGAGIKEHIMPSQALGIKNPVGGFIADVLLDPTTYITFGYGAEAKLATEAGEVVLSKAGSSLLKKSIEHLGEEAGRKVVAQKVLEDGGDKFLAKGGIKFMGKQIVPRSVATAPFKAADTLLEKTPVVGSMYQGAKDLAQKAFVPFKSIQDLPGGIGQQYVDKFSAFTKGTRDDVAKAMQEATELGKTAKKEIGDNAGTVISRLLEAPVTKDIEAGAEKVAEAPKTAVDKLTDFIRSQHQQFADVEKSKGILDTEIPDYVRHYLTPEGREFLNKTGMNITAELNKPLRVKNPFAKTRQLDGTIEGINKYFQGKYGVQLFEPDAFKAFAARKVEHIKAVNTYDFLTNIGKQFGKKAEVITKQIKNPVTGEMVSKDVIKPIFENGIKYVESSVPQLKGTLLPEDIVKHVDDTYRTLSNEDATKGFLKMYDKVLGFWKGSVTGWFPSFHTRNTIGGVFNNWIAGVTNPARYLQADQIARGVEGKITTKLGTKYSFDQIRELANKLGVLGQPGYLDVMDEVGKNIEKGGVVSKLMDAPKNAMGIVENRLRLPLFVDRLIKGDAPEAAAKDVFKFHFDYAPEALTPFEKNVMKRVMPFYRWTRGNIPLQLGEMVKQPGKYAAIGKLTDDLQSDKEKAKEEYSALPPYMREDLPIRLGEKNGFSQYLYGLGLPVEDVNRLWKGSALRTLSSTIGDFSPLLKTPIELGTGQNLFTGEPISENSYVYPFVNQIPGLKQWLDVSEHKDKDGSISYRADPYKLYFLNTALGRFYTTAGKLTDDNTSGAVKFLYGLLGAKAKNVDIEKERYYRDKDEQDAIESQLENKGLLREYQRAYIPK